jgi:prolyl oligopeptidase
MRRLILFGATVGLMAIAACRTTPSSAKRLDYPPTRTVQHFDDYNGVKVADPYRWLENDNSAETKAWVESQNKVTFGYLEQIPERSKIKDRLTKLWNYERYGVPFKEGHRYFFTKNDGLQNQSVLYTMRALEETPRVLLDPNKLSTDGTIALSGYTITDDGQLMAYGLSTAGSDWQEWKVREIESGRDLPDTIKWVKSSSASWTKDGKGFFYSRYDAPSSTNTFKGVNYYHKLYFHRLGTDQDRDVLVYDRPDQKEWGFYGGVTDDGRYLVITVWQGTDTRNRVFYKDLQSPGNSVVELLNDFDADYTFIDNIGESFLFRTDQNAPRGRVIAIDITKPQRSNWRELIPQTEDRLEGVNLVNDTLIAIYLHDAHSLVRFHSKEGERLKDFALPGIGSIGGFGGKRTDTETFYTFTSFTTPGTVYRVDLQSGHQSVFRASKVDFQPSDYETKQVFFPSKDGTRVPMFITHKKGLVLNGNNPTLLYGYGGFDISLTPAFSVGSLVWMEMGGVFAEPNLRGGGEYGRDWHLAGTKLQKQNVFDDFVSAAQWLIANKYTNPKKLAISGGSNGGLLVGACMTQHPELFAVALPAVGVMDMLRFNKFTRGWAWTSDYGSPEEPQEFKALYAYSPLHNLKPGTHYPATLVTTADHDDRVVPAHSFKFAARLQACQAGPAPTLIRIETKAGHGAGKPTTKIIEEAADKWAFVVRELGMKPSLGSESKVTSR